MQSHANDTTMGRFPWLTPVQLSPQVPDHMAVSSLPPYIIATSHKSGQKAASLAGKLLQMKPAPPHTPVKPWTSPNKPTLNPSYSQIVKTSLVPRAGDPGKPHMTTHDHKSPSISHVTTCDPGKASGDLPRDWSPTQSLGHVNFKCVTCLFFFFFF